MQQIIDHLQSHPNNSISIEFQGKKKVNPFVASNRYLFTKNNIESGWNNVATFLKGLKHEGFGSGTKVYLRIPNGSTTKVINEPITLQFSGDLQDQHTNSTAMRQTVQHQQPTHTSQSYYGMNGGMMGVHPAESKLEAVREKYEDLKDRYDTLKNEHADLRSRERQLNEQNNSLKLEVNTAEKHKELAILQANLNQKSFFDSDTMKTIAANLAPVFQQKINGQQIPVGMGTPSDLSNEKKQFIEFIASDRVADQDINNVYKVYKNVVQNKEFATALQGLFTQFNIT